MFFLQPALISLLMFQVPRNRCEQRWHICICFQQKRRSYASVFEYDSTHVQWLRVFLLKFRDALYRMETILGVYSRAHGLMVWKEWVNFPFSPLSFPYWFWVCSYSDRWICPGVFIYVNNSKPCSVHDMAYFGRHWRVEAKRLKEEQITFSI